MRRKIPSTTALSAFEAAARHQSYTKAAAELAVTQGAVCRQIASLERFLGVRLFQRSSRGVALTTAGLSYARQVRVRLDEVERDAFDIMSHGGNGSSLELAVVPTFATKWLLPRLSSFNREHPGVHVHLTAQTRPFLFDETQFDAAVYAGASPWPGTEGLFLMKESLVPVCSPQLARGRVRFSVKDWECNTLLQQSTRPYAWREWFAASGSRIDGDMTGPRLELFSMLIQAAICGMGIALIPTFLVQEELSRGLLVTLTREPQDSGRIYFLIYPERNADDPALRSLGAWLQRQIRAPTTST